jgi:hypothetical protein
LPQGGSNIGLSGLMPLSLAVEAVEKVKKSPPAKIVLC